MPKAELPPLPHELIQRRAYELYELRGRQEGRQMEDWLQAEQDVRAAVSAAAISAAAADVRVEAAPRNPARRRSPPKPRQAVAKTSAPPRLSPKS
jgi:hypothetical protein